MFGWETTMEVEGQQALTLSGLELCLCGGIRLSHLLHLGPDLHREGSLF